MTDKVEKGAFIGSLKRTNKDIKGDRAEAIAEDAEMSYRRSIEDMQVSLKRLAREQENMLDLSPGTSYSLMLGEDFDSSAFITRDAEVGLDIHNTTTKLNIAIQRYTHLFGAL